MNALIRRRLCELVARQGELLGASAEQSRAAVEQVCRRHPTEQHVLQSIVDLGMLPGIVQLGDESGWPKLEEELAGRLRTERALDLSAARWGLQTWALALGKIAEEAASVGESHELG